MFKDVWHLYQDSYYFKVYIYLNTLLLFFIIAWFIFQIIGLSFNFGFIIVLSNLL